MKRLFYILVGIGLFLPVLAFAADNNVSQTAYQLFNPSAIQNGTDLSIGYLGDIYGVVDGVLHGSGSQVMGRMFMVFNAGALILGGMIVIYTSMISLLNTANEGEMLGKKWNSIWIPLRTVLGIALLIPKATGYCAIQVFMMWVIVQGVGLADNVWNSVVGYLAEGGVLVQQSQTTSGGVYTSAENMFRQTLCLAGLQAQFNQASQEPLIINPKQKSGSGVGVGDSANVFPPVPNFLESVASLPNVTAPSNASSEEAARVSANVKKYCSDSKCTVDLPNFTFPAGEKQAIWNRLNGVCGSVSWSIKTTDRQKVNALWNPNIEKAYTESIRVGVQQMLLDLSGPAQTVINTFVFPPKGTAVPPNATLSDYISNVTIENAAQDYQGIVYPAQRIMTNIAKQGITDLWAKLANEEGWIDAGSYYQVMTQQNTSAAAAIFTAPGSSSASSLSNKLPKSLSVGPYTVNTSTLNSFITQDGKSAGLLGSYIANAPTGKGSGAEAGKEVAVTLDLGGMIAKVAMPLLSPLINVIQSFVGLLSSQETNANPVVMIALMGNGLIALVVEVWIVGALTLAGATAVLGIIPSVEEATTMTVLVEWIVPFLWGISGLLFVEGAVMAFYVPMIPFILFVFGAIGWLIATIEAMVAAPLVALGITHPEGAEVMGKSDPAVLLLVNVFLRPSMMIIGFIAGIILSYVSIWLLNVGFLQFLLGGVSGGAGSFMTLEAKSPLGLLFGLPFVLIIYVSLVIIILDYCFSLINVVPDKVLRWLGGQVEGVAGEAGKMAGQAKSAGQSAAKGASDSAKDLLGKQGQKEDKTSEGEAKGNKGDEKDKSSVGGNSEGGTDVKVGDDKKPK